MVQIGQLAGRKVEALISDMNQPLGRAVGNALEIHEAIQTLHGNGPDDLREHCLVLASHMLVLGQRAPNLTQARHLAESALHSGAAWQKFRALVQAQGGDVSVIDSPDRLPQARFVETFPAPRDGYILQIHARQIGETAVLLGAGRAKKTDPVDHAVGILIHKKVGDFIKKDEPLFTVHANDQEKLKTAMVHILNAHLFSEKEVKPLPLFYN